MKIKNLLTTKKAHLHQHMFTKDNKRVIFQEMVHVAPSKFYKNLNFDILNFLLKNRNGKVFIEGIIKDNPNKLAAKKLSSIIGITDNLEYLDLNKLFHILAKLTGFETQDTDNYIKYVPMDKIIKVDITDTEFYNKLKDIPDKCKSTDINTKSINDILDITILKPVFFVIKLYLRAYLRNTIINNTSTNKLPPIIQNAIIHDRNEFLVNEIVNSKDKDIFVTYGKGHLEGVKELLLDNGFSYTLYKSLEY